MPTFDGTANNQVQIPVVSHASGSGSLVLGVSGTAFPAPPFRITAIVGASYATAAEVVTIYAVSAVAANTPGAGQCTLAATAIESTTDRAYTSSDFAEMRITAGTLADLNAAVAAIPGFPLAIAGGGTGQVAAPAAYNALSPMTTLGDLEFESAANTASRLAGNTTTTKKFLAQAGNGTVSAAPAWATILAADLPTGIPNANLANASVTIAAVGGLAGGGAVALGGTAAVSLAIFNPTAAKTANYTAALNDLVMCDCSAGSFTVTLPTAPADKSVVGVKLISVSGAFALAIAAGGSAVFNKAGGSATLTANVVNQTFFLQYFAAATAWIVVAADNSPGGYAAGTGIAITPSGGVRTITATAAGGRGWVLGAGTPLVVGTNVTNNTSIMQAAGNFSRVDLAVGTNNGGNVPTGSGIVVDILQSANGGSTWTSLWAANPGNRPSIAAGAVQGHATAFDTTAYAAGNLLRVDVVQVGSTNPGSNLTVELI